MCLIMEPIGLTSYETTAHLSFHTLKDRMVSQCECTAQWQRINELATTTRRRHDDDTTTRRRRGDDDTRNATRTQVQPQTPTINGNPSLRIREKHLKSQNVSKRTSNMQHIIMFNRLSEDSGGTLSFICGVVSLVFHESSLGGRCVHGRSWRYLGMGTGGAHLNQMELKPDIFLQNLYAKMIGEYRFIWDLHQIHIRFITDSEILWSFLGIMLEKMIRFSVSSGSLNESGRWEVVWQPVDSNKMKYGCFKVISKTLNFTVSEDGVLQVLNY